MPTGRGRKEIGKKKIDEGKEIAATPIMSTIRRLEAKAIMGRGFLGRKGTISAYVMRFYFTRKTLQWARILGF
jgi:hypothetical protein